MRWGSSDWHADPVQSHRSRCALEDCQLVGLRVAKLVTPWVEVRGTGLRSHPSVRGAGCWNRVRYVRLFCT